MPDNESTINVNPIGTDNIVQNLNNIANAVYGREVRTSIHDAILACYTDASTGETIAAQAAIAAQDAASDANEIAEQARSLVTELSGLDIDPLAIAISGNSSPIPQESFDWERGTINGSDGGNQSGDSGDPIKRVRTTGYLALGGASYVGYKIEDGYKVAIRFYSGNEIYSHNNPGGKQSQNLGSTGFVTGGSLVQVSNFPGALYIRCVVADVGNSEIPLENVDLYGSKLKLYLRKGEDYEAASEMLDGLITSNKDSLVDAVNSVVNDLNSGIQSLSNDLTKSELYIGSFVQGQITGSSAGGIVTNANRIVNATRGLAFPVDGKYRVNINPKYKLVFGVGPKPNDLSNTWYWFRNGDEFSVVNGDFNVVSGSATQGTGQTKKSALFYRICVALENDNTAFTPEEASDLDLHIMYDPDYDTKTYNSSQESIALASALSHSPTGRPYFSNKGNVIIAHTSDTHGDYERLKRFYDYCDHIGVDAACHTGDIVGMYAGEGFEWFHDIVNSHDCATGFCIGNHDINNNSNSLSTQITDEQAYNTIMAPIIGKLKTTSDATADPNPNPGLGWYFADFDKGLRIISVNLYQWGGGGGATNPRYNPTDGSPSNSSARWYTHFTNDQLLWFAKALYSAPSGYAIVVLIHSPQMEVEKDTQHASFWGYDPIRSGEFHNDIREVIGGESVDASPVYDIVDAFINKTVIDKEYTQAYDQSASPSHSTCSIEFNFGDSGCTDAEFVAYLSGHSHLDTIGYSYANGSTTPQLHLNITLTSSVYGTSYKYYANISDIPRNRAGVTQDAFNIYAIDRDAGVVRVTRIGSTHAYGPSDRSYMEIPYRIS